MAMTRSRLNGAGALRELEALGFVPSGPQGDPEALWGRCPKCSLRALKVGSPVPYAAQCVRCGHCPTLTELLSEVGRPRRQPSDWLKTLEQLEAESGDDPDVDWLVDGLLPRDGLSLLLAPPKVGKSTLARGLAVATSGDRTKWLGKQITHHGPVIHLALEERIRTVLGHYGRLEADRARIHLLYGRPPPAGKRPAMLRKAIEALQPALVVVDPLQRWKRISDGNDYSEVTEALTPLIDLARECGTHLMLVHHSREGWRGARGGSARIYGPGGKRGHRPVSQATG